MAPVISDIVIGIAYYSIPRIRQQRSEIKVLYMSGYTDNAIVHQGVLDPGTGFPSMDGGKRGRGPLREE